MSFLKKIWDIVSDKKYRKHDGEQKISPAQYKALNIGAINAEQTMCFCDSLETGIEKKDLHSNLENYYDIIDRETALTTLDWLLRRGHRTCYEAIKNFVAGSAPSINDSIVDDDEKLKYTIILKTYMRLLAV